MILCSTDSQAPEPKPQELPAQPTRLPIKIRLLAALRNHLPGSESGSSLVELAVTLPIILLIMTGIFTFSIAFNQKLVLAEAVSTGGRFLATDRGDTDPCATTATRVYAASPSLSSSAMTFNISITNGSTTTSYTTPTCSGATMTTGGTATLRISYPCTLQVYGLNLSKCTLTDQIAEAIQ